MNNSWWVSYDQLIDEQREAIRLSRDESFLVVGPPGSGKTNLLVLRGNFLSLSERENLIILTFTRTLREFVAAGTTHYNFPSSKVMTYSKWQRDLLYEYGIDAHPPEGFEESRRYYFEQIAALAADQDFSSLYSAILVDEAQDYRIDELRLLRRLGATLFLTADARQQIYKHNATIAEMESLVNRVHVLRHHHRCGRKICAVADALAKQRADGPSLVESSNYNEESNPSSVAVHPCSSREEECDRLIAAVELQLRAYPDELIGVLSPRVEFLDLVCDRLSRSPFAQLCARQTTGEYVPFEEGKQVYVSTVHSAKGVEFRCVHLVAADRFQKCPMPRNLAFTAITRAKTSLSLYHTGPLPGYLGEALTKALSTRVQNPSMRDVFSGGR